MTNKSAQVREVKMSMIEADHKKHTMIIPPRRKTKKIMYMPGRCKICGASYDVLTLHHANKHGFATREEMFAAGVIELKEEKRRKKCLRDI